MTTAAARASQPKISIKAIKEPLYRKLTRDGDMLTFVDDLFGCAVVYAYCSFSDLKVLYKKIYGNELDIPSAGGYCFHGLLNGSGGHAELVWVNNIRERKDDAIPTFMHEISHLADNIVKGANVEDSNEEVKAHIIERESRRVLNEMFGVCATKFVTYEMLKGVLK